MESLCKLEWIQGSICSLGDNVVTRKLLNTAHIYSFVAVDNIELIILFIILQLQNYLLCKTVQLIQLALPDNNLRNVSVHKYTILGHRQKMHNNLLKHKITSSRLERSTGGEILSVSFCTNNLY